MSLNEKPVTGAHVVEANVQSTSTNLLPPHSSFDNASSTTSLTPTYDQNSTPTEEYTPSSEHPFSPFYLHPTTRTSFEQHQSESKIHIRIHEQDDLEAASTNFPSSEVSRNHKENAVWPCNNQKHKRSLMMERRKGGCSPLRGLNKKQKLWAKIIIALVVIGAAVGIGIGISKAVGAGCVSSSPLRPRFKFLLHLSSHPPHFSCTTRVWTSSTLCSSSLELTSISLPLRLLHPFSRLYWKLDRIPHGILQARCSIFIGGHIFVLILRSLEACGKTYQLVHMDALGASMEKIGEHGVR